MRAGLGTGEDVVRFLAWQECGYLKANIKRHAYQ